MKELTQALRLSPSEIPHRIYGVENWGAGFFSVSEQGCLTVHPTRNPLMGIEVINLMPAFMARGPQLYFRGTRRPGMDEDSI